MLTWTCIKHCGACCFLDPSQRPDLESYLSSNELKHYYSLVGEDGWCVHYEKETRTCRIYEQRPSFCRVSPENFQQRYGVEITDFDEFAIDCCCEHIIDLYGEDSREIDRYLKTVED